MARLLDGSPLLLMGSNQWRSRTLSQMRLQDDDVMDMAREQGIRDFSGIRAAVLETYGQINIIPAEQRDRKRLANPETRVDEHD